MPNCAHCGASVASGARQCTRCGVTLSGRDQATLPGLGHAAAPLAADAMLGRSIIGQFVVRSKLADGGMGGVYLADQPTVGRTAVIKVIHPWLAKDPAIVARFEAEARAAARLQNSHIVSIYNYGKLPDGTLFLAMEHIEGITLSEALVSQGRLEPARAVAIATQCCEALAEAHRRGVVHRDVKPSNIMLQQRRAGPGFVKMLDFGVASIDDRDEVSGRGFAGTPCYMSPEQLADQTVDGRSDIYSLAIVIYEMIVGQPPFLAPTPEKYAQLHREVPPPAPSALAPEVSIPHALEACLMRALAKQPHARPQTAERFAEELWAAMEASSVHVQETPLPSLPPPRRHVGLARGLVGAGLLVASACIVGALWWRSRSEPDPATPSVAPSPAPVASEDPSRPDPLLAVLEQRSVVELEVELERAAVLTGHGSKAVNVAMTQYHQEARVVPRGLDPDEHRRAVLARLIVDWARGPRAEGSPFSIAELEAVFLRMNGPLDVQERRNILRELKNREGTSADAIARVLVNWIGVYGLDYQTGEPGAELVLEDE